MSFATAQNLALFFFSAALAVILASDTDMVKQRPWILPTLLTAFLSLGVGCALLAWFERGRSGRPERSRADKLPIITQKTRGDFSPTYAAERMVINNDVSLPRNSPSGQREAWPATLEAAMQSAFQVGEAGYVIAMLSSKESSDSKECTDRRSRLAQLGRIEREHCSVSFRNSDGYRKPARIRFQLVTASPHIHCSKSIIDLELNWEDKFKQVQFPVYADAAGHYRADVALLVRRMQVASVALSTEASIKDVPETDFEQKDYQLLARVTVEFQITMRYTKERDHSLSKEHYHREDYSQGHSM